MWNAFIVDLNKKGQKIFASNLAADVPRLSEDYKLHITLPNDTMKKEIEREQYTFISHLRKELNNYDIAIEITVVEEDTTQYAFTPMEKYERLVEKNPLLDRLRIEFDLNI